MKAEEKKKCNLCSRRKKEKICGKKQIFQIHCTRDGKRTHRRHCSCWKKCLVIFPKFASLNHHSNTLYTSFINHIIFIPIFLPSFDSWILNDFFFFYFLKYICDGFSRGLKCLRHLMQIKFRMKIEWMAFVRG